MEAGSLEVVVYRGKDLSGKKMDESPTSSVEIKLGKELVGTRVVENNKNPQWNTVHKFTNVDITNPKLSLDLTLRDKKDKFMGRIVIPLSETLYKDGKTQPRVEKWYPLRDRRLEDDPSITGEIQVKLRFFSAQEEREKEEAKLRAKDKVYEDRAKDRGALMEGKKPTSLAPKPSPFGDDHGSATGVDRIAEEEIQAIVKQTEQVRQESKASTTRTLQTLGEAQEIASVTSEKLAHQGEQLQRITGDSYKIEDDMKIASRQIRGIKSIFGAVANVFSRSPGPTKRKQSKNKKSSDSKDKSSKDEPSKVVAGNGYQVQVQDPAHKMEDDEIDRDLDQISNGIANLRNIATEMGREIDSQTKTIDTLMEQTEKNDGLLRKNNNKIRR